MKKQLFICIVLFLSVNLYGIDRTNQFIIKSEELIKQKKYETAFTYLSENEDKINHSDLVIQQVDKCIKPCSLTP